MKKVILALALMAMLNCQTTNCKTYNLGKDAQLVVPTGQTYTATNVTVTNEVYGYLLTATAKTSVKVCK